MADFTLQIQEKVTLGGIVRDSITTQTLSNINYVDNRILTIPSGSYTPLFYFNPSNVDAGTFTTGSFKYGRITNKSSTVPIQVRITADSVPSTTLTNTSFIVTPGDSFFLSTTAITGSSPGSNTFVFNQYVYYVSVAPSGSSASIEYFSIGT